MDKKWNKSRIMDKKEEGWIMADGTDTLIRAAGTIMFAARNGGSREWMRGERM